ncbi:hypothetical protein X975_01693, partial [Stegodyphus mimosarum]
MYLGDLQVPFTSLNYSYDYCIFCSVAYFYYCSVVYYYLE